MIIVYLLILLTSFAISSSYISYFALSFTSSRSFWYMQGNTQLIKQFGSILGAFYYAFYLQRSLKEWNDESATIIGAFPNFKAVAAPMLLPQSTTLHLLWVKYCTTVYTCLASRTPKLTVYPSELCPHPMKSKEANEKLKGRNFNMEVASILEEELPCR